jgi:serine/threonine-protein kinase
VLWELATWKVLPQKGDPLERWRKAAYPKWDPPSSVRASVPLALDTVLMRALATEPAQRFPDAAALGAELKRLKEKLAPNVGDADVARLMREAFAEEKAQEDAVLAELLEQEPSRARTEQLIPAKLAPPTALAFEHSGLEAPEDYVPGEDAAHSISRTRPQQQSRSATREARVSFGLDVASDPGVGMVEAPRPPLVRAIEGDDESLPPEAETGETDWRWMGWLAVGLFLGACAVGFGVVWLLAHS